LCTGAILWITVLKRKKPKCGIVAIKPGRGIAMVMLNNDGKMPSGTTQGASEHKSQGQTDELS